MQQYEKGTIGPKPKDWGEGVYAEGQIVTWEEWNKKAIPRSIKQREALLGNLTKPAGAQFGLPEQTLMKFEKVIPDTPVEYTCVWCGKEMRSEALLEIHEEEHFND